MTYTIKGNFEVEQADNFKEELMSFLDSKESSIQIDMSDLEFIDISCSQVLFSFLKEARERRVAVSIIRPNDDILQFFSMCGFLISSDYFESTDLMDILVV